MILSDFKLGICEWAFPLPGPGGLSIASEMGLQGMELDFGDYEKGFPLSNSNIQKTYLENGKKYSVEFPSMAVNALCAHGMTHPEESSDGMIAILAIKKAIQAAAEMGIPVLQLPSFDDGAIRNEVGFYNTCEKLRMACEIAQTHGIIIATENDLSVKESLKLIEEVNTSNFKIFYDTQNYYLNRGYYIRDHLNQLLPHICQIHIKDGFNGKISSALLGNGDTDFYHTAKLIKDSKCTTWLFLENYYNVKPLSNLDNDPFKLLADDIKIAKETFGIQTSAVR